MYNGRKFNRKVSINMSHWLQKVFWKLGLDVRRIPSSRREFGRSRITMEEGLRHLRGLNFVPQTVIDVGAGYGTTPLLEVFPEAHYLWLEPLQEFESKLEQLRPKYKGDIIIAAAGSQAGKTSIAVEEGLLGSSMQDDGSYGNKPTREIDVITLNSLKDKMDLTQDIFLKVDVQGGELDVIAGADEILSSIDAILLEVSFFRFFKDIPIFDEVISDMKERGFTVYDILAGNTRPRDHALGQKDLLFVKTEGRFRSSQSWT